MKKITFGIICIGLILGYIFFVRNGIVSASLHIDTVWASLEPQYVQRVKLIETLPDTIRQGALADALARYTSAQTVDAKTHAAGDVETAYAAIIPVISVPTALNDTEDTLTSIRSTYNAVLREYNIRLTRFPSSLIAALFGFDVRPYFRSAGGEE